MEPTIPTGRLTLFSILPVLTVIDGLKSTFNVRDTVEDKTTPQKVLFYRVFSVSSTGTTNEMDRLHQETKPLEVQR